MKCPHCFKEIPHTTCTESLLNRRELILSKITGEVKLEILYRRLRTRGYRMGREAFSRDLKVLEENGLIKSKLVNAGNKGRYKVIWI